MVSIERRQNPEAHPEQLASDIRQRIGTERLYAFYLRDVSWSFGNGVLVLRGRVPTSNLRRALEGLLAGINGVREIDNRVVVVNASGLIDGSPASDA